MSAIILLLLGLFWTIVLGREDSPVPVLFYLSVATPLLSAGIWLGMGRGAKGRLLALASAWIGWLVAAVSWHGFSFGNQDDTHLISCLIFFTALALGAMGVLECLVAIRVPTSVAVGITCLGWSLLVTSPFFLISWLSGLFSGVHEQALAGWIVTLHPFSAACDAAGGFDGWRNEILYSSAEIGARYAYRYPSWLAYSALCALPLALARAPGLARTVWLRWR